MPHCKPTVCLLSVVMFLLLLGGDVAPLSAASKEVVRFRLKDWKSVHLSDDKKAEMLAATLKKLGCETAGHSHGDHIDIRYRCVKWRSISADSHEKAHSWEKWLKKLQFETQHQH